MHWQPNHFVPCRLSVGKSSDHEHSMLMALPISHASSPLVQDKADSPAAPLTVQDRSLSHANSPLVQDKADSPAAPLTVQDRSLSHANSPLVQDKADSPAAPLTVQDRSLSHANSPLVQDKADSPAAPLTVQDRSLSHANSPLVQDKADSPAAPLTVQDRSLSHANSPLVQDKADSPAALLTVQDRSLSHANSPLFQDKADSPAAPLTVQDISLAHANSPLVQDKADSPAAPLTVQDRSLSHANSPLVLDKADSPAAPLSIQESPFSLASCRLFLDGSTADVGQETQLSLDRDSDTCKILQVHLELSKEKKTSSKSKAVDSAKGMKFYFKPVNKSKLGHSSSYAKEQPQHFPITSNPPLIQNQSTFQVDSSDIQLHPTVTHNQPRIVVDSPQLLLPVKSSTVEEEPDIADSPVPSLLLDSSVLQKQSSYTHSFDVQRLSPVDPSLVKSAPSRPFISDSSILDVHLSLIREGDYQHKPKGTGGLRAYSKSVSKEEPYYDKISGRVAHSLEDDTTAQSSF